MQWGVLISLSIREDTNQRHDSNIIPCILNRKKEPHVYTWTRTKTYSLVTALDGFEPLESELLLHVRVVPMSHKHQGRLPVCTFRVPTSELKYSSASSQWRKEHVIIEQGSPGRRRHSIYGDADHIPATSYALKLKTKNKQGDVFVLQMTYFAARYFSVEDSGMQMGQIMITAMAFQVSGSEIIARIIKQPGHKITASIGLKYLGRPQTIQTDDFMTRKLTWRPVTDDLCDPETGEQHISKQVRKEYDADQFLLAPTPRGARRKTVNMEPFIPDNDHLSNPYRLLPMLYHKDSSKPLSIDVYNFNMASPNFRGLILYWKDFLEAYQQEVKRLSPRNETQPDVASSSSIPSSPKKASLFGKLKRLTSRKHKSPGPSSPRPVIAYVERELISGVYIRLGFFLRDEEADYVEIRNLTVIAEDYQDTLQKI